MPASSTHCFRAPLAASPRGHGSCMTRWMVLVSQNPNMAGLGRVSLPKSIPATHRISIVPGLIGLDQLQLPESENPKMCLNTPATR